MTDLTLVENILIPHVLKVIVSDEFEMDYKWIVLDELIKLWKTLSRVSTSNVRNFILYIIFTHLIQSRQMQLDYAVPL